MTVPFWPYGPHQCSADEQDESNCYIYYILYIIYYILYIYYIYSTICRHACFGVLRNSSSTACYTSRYVMTSVYIHTQLLLPSACGTPRATNASRHAQSIMGPECSNNPKE